MAKKQAAAPTAPKSKCPITRDQFNKDAKPITVKIGDSVLVATPKQFATGSMGWYAGEKVVVTIDGIPCKVQVGLNLTVVGSKEL